MTVVSRQAHIKFCCELCLGSLPWDTPLLGRIFRSHVLLIFTCHLQYFYKRLSDPLSIQLNSPRTYCNLDAIGWHHFCCFFCLPQDYSKPETFQWFQLRLDPIRRSELDRTRILTESFSISYNCSFHLFVFGIILVKPTGSARRLAIWRSHSADESSRRKGTSWLERSLVTGAACAGRCQTKKTSGRFGRSDFGVGVWHIKEDIGMINIYSLQDGPLLVIKSSEL